MIGCVSLVFGAGIQVVPFLIINLACVFSTTTERS